MDTEKTDDEEDDTTPLYPSWPTSTSHKTNHHQHKNFTGNGTASSASAASSAHHFDIASSASLLCMIVSGVVILLVVLFLIGCIVGSEQYEWISQTMETMELSLFGSGIADHTHTRTHTTRIYTNRLHTLPNNTSHRDSAKITSSADILDLDSAASVRLYPSNSHLMPPPLQSHPDTVWCKSHMEACQHNAQEAFRYQERATRIRNMTNFPKHTCNIHSMTPVRLLINDQRFEDWTYANLLRAQSFDTCPTPCALTTVPANAHILIYVQSLIQGYVPRLPHQYSAVLIMEAFEGTAWKPEGFHPSLVTDADFLLSFDRRSDIWINYYGDFLGLERKAQWACERNECFHEPLIPFQTLHETHTAYSAIFISNCDTAIDRAKFMIELMTLIPIDSYGPCWHSSHLPDADKSGGYLPMWSRKFEISKQYLFTLVVENWIRDDYVTEKFYQSLLYGTVPVYLGATNIAQYFPANKSVINIHDFPTVSALAEYLIYLRQNESEYEQWRDWRRDPVVRYNKEFLSLRHWSQFGWEEDHYACKLCNLYAERYCNDWHDERALLVKTRYS